MNSPKQTRTAHYCPFYTNNPLIDFNYTLGNYCHCVDVKSAHGKSIPIGVTANEYNERNKAFQSKEDAFELPASTTLIFGTKELAEQFTKERIFDPVSCQMKNALDAPEAPQEKDTGAHYRFQLSIPVTQSDLERGYAVANIDPYKIADCYGITNHAIFSALKKLLVAGGRGFKDTAQDVADSIGALQRWQQMQEEQVALAKMVGKSLKSKETYEAPAVCTTVDRDEVNLADLRDMQAGFGNPVEPMTVQEALKIKRLGDV
jgi:hypothetical protein